LPARVSGSLASTQLDGIPYLCKGLPRYTIVSIKSSNLGGKGPDKDRGEGIFYAAKGENAGPGMSDVTLELHAASDHDFVHGLSEGDEVADNYEPMWPKENGYYAHFARVNVMPGRNVTVMLKAVDPASGEDLVFPHVSLAFFDLDAGENGTGSVEYLKIRGYKHYYVTNSTELRVTHDGFGDTIFTASREGTGSDNPTDPLTLTAMQKDRVVSFDFEDTGHLLFQLGASEGNTARVFDFALRPGLRCADTRLADNSTLPADDPKSPVRLVRVFAPSGLRAAPAGGSAGTPGPQPAALALGLLALLAPRGEA